MKTINENLILFEEIILGGWNFSHPLKRGTCMRLTDVEGGANASMLIYNHANYSERYNMADTLKAQFTSYLTKGHALFSDMGRILLSIIDDTCGWHDTITACSTPQSNLEKYGERKYQQFRNAYYRDGLTSLLTEVSKYGMTLRNLHSHINFFTAVQVDNEGNLSFISQPKKGSYVDLQAEMDSLVVLNTCPHALDPSPVYAPKPVRVTIWRSECKPEENPCYHTCEQNKRGFINTINY
ncbi:MAG: urea carboxylase-associated family protein, partial [Bacteroides sp.]|nr:urea carboxylase-associated family protein [Bacteroides sp.]